MTAWIPDLLQASSQWAARVTGRMAAGIRSLLVWIRSRIGSMRPLMARAGLWLLRISITLAAAAGAILVIRWMWFHYELAPWTRDGRVRADIVKVAPDEPGWVTSVAVVDNQRVRKGDLLFRLDTARYEIALRHAEAAVAQQRPVLAEASVRRVATKAWVIWSPPRFENRARLVCRKQRPSSRETARTWRRRSSTSSGP